MSESIMNTHSKIVTMIAEDDEVSRLALRSFVEKLGHQIIECADGQEAWEQIEAGNVPDLLLLDWMMPRLNGLEVCRAVRANKDLPYIHIVITTSKDTPDEIIGVLRSGANDYLRKPVDAQELEVRVKSGLNLIQMNQMIQTQRTQLMNSSRFAYLGRMASGMAHEINNPLAILQGYATRVLELVENEAVPLSREGLKSTFSGVVKAVGRITNIIAALRDFSAETDREPMIQISVQSVLDKVSTLIAARAKAKGVDFQVVQPPTEVLILVQPNRLAYAILNLVENALLAAVQPDRKAPWIRLDVFFDSRQLCVAVSDSGPGVGPEIRDKIMTPFFTTREVGQGAGLGLSVARGIVESHRGKLELDTSSVHTRFTITLPRNGER